MLARSSRKKIEIYFLPILIWIINHVWLLCKFRNVGGVCHCALTMGSITQFSLEQKSCLFNCWWRFFPQPNPHPSVVRSGMLVIGIDNDNEVQAQEMCATKWRTIITSSPAKWYYGQMRGKKRMLFDWNALSIITATTRQAENGNRSFGTCTEFENSNPTIHLSSPRPIII